MLLTYPAVAVYERCGCGLFFVVSCHFECAGHVGDDEVGAGVPAYDHLTHCGLMRTVCVMSLFGDSSELVSGLVTSTVQLTQDL